MNVLHSNYTRTRQRYFLGSLLMLAVVAFGVCVAHVPLSAQVQVSFQLQDTTVKRGDLVRVAVRAVFRQLPASVDSIRFVVRYAPLSLAFQGALGGGANVMQCTPPRTDSQFVNLNFGNIQVSCAALRPLATNTDTVTLATLVFRTLASPDLTTPLSIESLWLNGILIPLLSSRQALITMQGAPLVAGEFPDAIGQNYPNPATLDGTTFPYTVAETGSVELSLLSSRGEVVLEFPPVNRRQGRYLLHISPGAALPSEMYIVRMITPRGVYYRSFLLRK